MLNKIAEKARELGFVVCENVFEEILYYITVELNCIQFSIYLDLDVHIDFVIENKLSNEDLYYMEKLGKLMYFIRELRIDKLLNKE